VDSFGEVERLTNLSPTSPHNCKAGLISTLKTFQLGNSRLAALIFSRVMSHAAENGLLAKLLGTNMRNGK
jgi:hypothetical protein